MLSYGEKGVYIIRGNFMQKYIHLEPMLIAKKEIRSEYWNALLLYYQNMCMLWYYVHEKYLKPEFAC